MLTNTLTRLNRESRRSRFFVGILLFLSILLIYPHSGLANTLDVKAGARISGVLTLLRQGCNNRQVLRQFDLAYDQGTKAFFQKVDPGKALPSFVLAIGLWKSSICSFVAGDKLEKVARVFVLATRSLLLLHRDKDAKNMAMRGLKQLDPTFFHVCPLPPDVAALFDASRTKTGPGLTIRVFQKKQAQKCTFFANGIEFRGHIRLVPGKYVVTVKCKNNCQWAETLDIQRDTRLNIAFGLAEKVVEIKKNGLVRINSTNADDFLTGLAFCTGHKRFFVSQAGITTQWSAKKGHWQPESEPMSTVKPVKIIGTQVKYRSKVRVLPIVLASAAVLVAGMGGTFNFLANRATSHINAGKNELDTRKNYTIAAWASYGTAAGLAVTAAILWIVQGTRYHPINVAVTPQGAAFSMSF